MSAVAKVVVEVKRGNEELVEEDLQKAEIPEKMETAEAIGIREKRQATDCEDSDAKKQKIEDVRQKTNCNTNEYRVLTLHHPICIGFGHILWIYFRGVWTH